MCYNFLHDRVQVFVLPLFSVRVVVFFLFRFVTIIYFESLCIVKFFACNSPSRQAAAAIIFFSAAAAAAHERYGRPLDTEKRTV